MRDVADPRAGGQAPPRSPQRWTVVLALFTITSAVEGIGITQIFAFLPLYLGQLGLPEAEVPRWVGVLNSLVFVPGLPLVPLWGVWADKYSRKAVIIRSALVEALVLAALGLSRTPWELAAGLMLAGFQLGNSGVMLAALRDITPRGRLGTTIAVFGASWSLGAALGPALGGLVVDGLHYPLAAVFWLSSVLSLATAAMLAAGFHEVRPERVPTGRVRDLAYGAIRGVLTEATTRRLFGLFGLFLLARQMCSPFVPLVVERANGGLEGLATAIALVMGTASLVGGLISPAAGAAGDRVGFRPVLVVAMAGSGLALALMPAAPNVPWLAAANVALAALGAAASAMIFGLLAVEVPPERRSATLNLVYLPLYLAGIAGPALGAVVVGAGVPVVFAAGGLVLVLGTVLVVRRGGRT